MASRRRGDPLGENDSLPLMIEPAFKLGQRFGPSGRDRKRGVDSTVRVSPRRPSSAVSATYAHGGGRLGLDLLQYLLDAVREAARCPIRDRQFVPDALMVATRGADVVRGRELPQTRGPARDCVGLSLLRVPDARLQKRSAPPPRRPSSAPPATYAHGDDRLGLDAVDGEATRCP